MSFNNMILHIFFIIVLVACNCQGQTELDALTEADRVELQELQEGWETNWKDYLVQLGKTETRKESRFASINDVKFYLWTRSNPDEKYVLNRFSNDSFLGSNFSLDSNTYVIFHGFSDSGADQWILNIKTALLEKYDCNVLSVDYGSLVRSPFYVIAVTNVYKVASLTAKVLDWLNTDFGLDFEKVHLAGHSLGAHAAGMTGHNVKSGTIARITGFDPAGPLFIHQKPEKMISSTSATFVDIIHSNGGSVADGCYGLYRPVGHADFYPNGGSHQAECSRLSDRGGCSHSLSYSYWIESIRSLDTGTPFTAWPCDSWDSFRAMECTDCGTNCTSEMGLNSIKGPSGKFFFYTNDEYPYAMGNSGKL